MGSSIRGVYSLSVEPKIGILNRDNIYIINLFLSGGGLESTNLASAKVGGFVKN